MASKSSPLLSAYTALLSRNRLQRNAFQASLVTRLSTLQEDLLLHSSPHHHSSTPPRGIYIHGSVGSGKTRLADLFHATLPARIPSRRAHFHAFMLDVHARLHLARCSADPLVAIGQQVARESRVLVLDEFQVTDIADAMILRRLFGAVWACGGALVATSNRRPEGLYERGLNRDLFVPFIAALRARCEVWEMGGEEDYRLRARRRAEAERRDVFFTDPLLFRNRLEADTAGAQMEEVRIPVPMSRHLTILAAPSPAGRAPAQQRRIASASFAQLCEAFLSAADYQALCASTATLYLAGVRPFQAHELDAARRFVTLVDLAYESKTRVVCLSSVPLGDVFRNVLPRLDAGAMQKDMAISVRREGGSSSSVMSTFVGEVEWSATGLEGASLAKGGAGESDVGFAVGRALSRLVEMEWEGYGVGD